MKSTVRNGSILVVSCLLVITFLHKNGSVAPFGPSPPFYDTVPVDNLITPADAAAVIDRLNAETNRILVTPEMKELTVRLNVEPPQARSIEQFRTLLVRDLDVWKKIVIDGKITAD